MPKTPRICQEKRLEDSIEDDGIGAMAAERRCHKGLAPHAASVHNWRISCQCCVAPTNFVSCIPNSPNFLSCKR